MQTRGTLGGDRIRVAMLEHCTQRGGRCGCAGLGVRGSKWEESEQGFAERSRDTLGTSSGQRRSEQLSQQIRVHHDHPTLASPLYHHCRP